MIHCVLEVGQEVRGWSWEHGTRPVTSVKMSKKHNRLCRLHDRCQNRLYAYEPVSSKAITMNSYKLETNVKNAHQHNFLQRLDVCSKMQFKYIFKCGTSV